MIISVRNPVRKVVANILIYFTSPLFLNRILISFQYIAKEIRKLLKIGEPKCNVSIADIPRDIKGRIFFY